MTAASRHRANAALALIAMALATPAAAHAASPCISGAGESAQVASVSSFNTLMLADGREIMLAGIEIPAGDDAAARASAAALRDTAGAIVLHDTKAPDRYRRVIAYVADATGETLQERLLARGHARVTLAAGEEGCARALLAAEEQARAARLGVWADPVYAIRRADPPAESAAETGRFTIVEGQVLSVRQSGATIYVNFGQRYVEGFAVTIARNRERAFSAAGMAPKSLEGRRVRVRGIVEMARGPRIEATSPAQIEILR